MDVFEARMEDGGEKSCTIFIGEVPLLAENPLLEVVRPVRRMHHRGLMIRLDVEIVAIFEMFSD